VANNNNIFDIYIYINFSPTGRFKASLKSWLVVTTWTWGPKS